MTVLTKSLCILEIYTENSCEWNTVTYKIHFIKKNSLHVNPVGTKSGVVGIRWTMNLAKWQIHGCSLFSVREKFEIFHKNKAYIDVKLFMFIAIFKKYPDGSHWHNCDLMSISV